jgi:hypothetical protein
MRRAAAAGNAGAVTGSDLGARQLGEEAKTANGIYGVIVGSGVMAADSGTSVTQLAVAVVVTLLVYWAAERYAHVVARRIKLGRKQTGRELRRELSDGWELVTASYLPLLVLVTASVLGADLTGAVISALVFSTALLSLSGWRVGVEANLGIAQRTLSATIAGAFGVVMILLQSFLH